MALIKKRQYWLKNIKGDIIYYHFALESGGNVDTFWQVEYRVSYINYN